MCGGQLSSVAVRLALSWHVHCHAQTTRTDSSTVVMYALCHP